MSPVTRIASSLYGGRARSYIECGRPTVECAYPNGFVLFFVILVIFGIFVMYIVTL